MSNSKLRVDDILNRFASPQYLGGGGQKQVYRVKHADLGTVVVKIGTFGSPQELERVRREVDVLRAINSPYFPKQYACDVVDATRYLIIEELIPGEPLHLSFHRFSTERDVLTLLYHLITGMGLLWSRRVVHRDLKPANIMIADDHPRIIDLGIARLLDSTSLTMSIAPFGPCTPNYASPEQLTNQKPGIDHRSDQFTLGIVSAQLLLGGQHPFDPRLVGQGASIPENILHGAWDANSLAKRCSAKVFNLIRRMLGAQPYMRYRRYEDLTQAIAAVMEA